MAINKNGTGYTFGFAIVMVIVVGAALAVTSMSLKPRQQANAADKKMMDILGAIQASLSTCMPAAYLCFLIVFLLFTGLSLWIAAFGLTLVIRVFCYEVPCSCDPGRRRLASDHQRYLSFTSFFCFWCPCR